MKKSLGKITYENKEKMINSKIGLKIKDYILTTPLSDVLYKTMHLFNLTTASYANETFSHLAVENNKYFQENFSHINFYHFFTFITII